VPTRPVDQTDTKPLPAHILAAKAETGLESKPTNGTEQTTETIGESDTPFVAVRRNGTQAKVPTKPAAKAETGLESKPTSGTEQTTETIGESDTPFVAVRRNVTQTKVPTKPATKAETGSESRPTSNNPGESVGKPTNGTEQTTETIGESDAPSVAVRRNVTQNTGSTGQASLLGNLNGTQPPQPFVLAAKANSDTDSKSKSVSNNPRKSIGKHTSGAEHTTETIGEPDASFVAVRRNITQNTGATGQASPLGNLNGTQPPQPFILAAKANSETGSKSKSVSNNSRKAVGKHTSGTKHTSKTDHISGTEHTTETIVEPNASTAGLPTDATKNTGSTGQASQPGDQNDTKPTQTFEQSAKANSDTGSDLPASNNPREIARERTVETTGDRNTPTAGLPTDATRNTGSTGQAPQPGDQNDTKPTQTFEPSAKANSDTGSDLPTSNNNSREVAGDRNTPTAGLPADATRNTGSTGQAPQPGDQNDTKPQQAFELSAKANSDMGPGLSPNPKNDTNPLPTHILAAKANSDTGSDFEPASDDPSEAVEHTGKKRVRTDTSSLEDSSGAEQAIQMTATMAETILDGMQARPLTNSAAARIEQLQALIDRLTNQVLTSVPGAEKQIWMTISSGPLKGTQIRVLRHKGELQFNFMVANDETKAFLTSLNSDISASLKQKLPGERISVRIRNGKQTSDEDGDESEDNNYRITRNNRDLSSNEDENDGR
ncbi:MAG: hypothetical protein P8X79_21215, partial [Reinekea sp.]